MRSLAKELLKQKKKELAKMASINLNQQIVVVVFILLVALGKSFAQARQVREVTVVATANNFSAEADSDLSLNKESPDSVLSAAEVESPAKIGGRKGATKTRNTSEGTMKEQSRSGKKASMAVRSVKSSKGDDDAEEKWKDHFMAFSADYHSPRQHPPRNN